MTDPTNDERIAAAIEDGDDDAPASVTATGRGALAERMLDIAFATGVKVRTDSDLAALLVSIEADCPVPTDALVAVAEVLTHVYRINQELDR
ncbi:MAG: EscU/YscU/HrcU family type III secretion system export apparatus switch protein [Pseudomonadota bacterium]|nr:EscU/YscU/HrcU family type III secretion system export apparatus switch protein [Pseudomonadota bacterium]